MEEFWISNGLPNLPTTNMVYSLIYISINIFLEIGLLAILTSEGRVIIYSPPIISHPQVNQVYEIQPQIQIFLSGKTISAFDWLNNSHNDVIACGDLTGNIFLVKLFPQSKFEVIKIYYQAHSEEITDLRFFPCNSEDNPLFASSSNDGFLKIFDTHNHETPLFEMHVSKVFLIF